MTQTCSKTTDLCLISHSLKKKIEKTVLTQLQEHLTGNGLLETYQSAYRKEHSTKTALLSVTDSLLSNTDNRLASIVAFLDLSAAFDTPGHKIMLKRLNITYGIHAKALQWMSSYLSDRQQSVTIGSISSKSVPLQSGVLQGSVLGPILFTLYTQPLSNTIQKHQFDYHKYADDTELEKAALPSDFSQVSRETEVCVADVNDWMNKNKLKLNKEKTELLVLEDRTRLCQVKKEPLTFGPNAFPFQTSAKYLGVHLDETLSTKEAGDFSLPLIRLSPAQDSLYQTIPFR